MTINHSDSYAWGVRCEERRSQSLLLFIMTSVGADCRLPNPICSYFVNFGDNLFAASLHNIIIFKSPWIHAPPCRIQITRIAKSVAQTDNGIVILVLRVLIFELIRQIDTHYRNAIRYDTYNIYYIFPMKQALGALDGCSEMWPSLWSETPTLNSSKLTMSSVPHAMG